jgi:hypothetical protein
MGVLEATFAAIQNCVEDCSHVYYDIEQDDLIVTVNGKDLPAYLLSDGQRTILAMVADIAYRAAQLNPQLERNAPQETPGIVLIDELDLHLHPNWQRKIVNTLKTTFPKIQFFASTHSPFIIQSLQPGELVDLDGRHAEYADKSIEDIAEQQMGVPIPQRSERYLKMKAAAEEYYQVGWFPSSQLGKFGWFPSSQLGNPIQEAPASCHSAKLELGASDNVGRWIPAKTETS